MSPFLWLRQNFFCRHQYRKHWSRASGQHGGYVRRCTKCGKILDIESH